jgi:hypothetical protein
MEEHLELGKFGQTAIVEMFERTTAVFKSMGAGSRAMWTAESKFIQNILKLSNSISMPKSSPRHHHKKWLKKVDEIIRVAAKAAAFNIKKDVTPNMRMARIYLEYAFSKEMSDEKDDVLSTIQDEFSVIEARMKSQQQKSDSALTKMQESVMKAIEMESSVHSSSNKEDDWTWYVWLFEGEVMVFDDEVSRTHIYSFVLHTYAHSTGSRRDQNKILLLRQNQTKIRQRFNFNSNRIC